MVKTSLNWAKRSLEELSLLREEMLRLEDQSAELLDGVADRCTDSARNLLHYVALRRHDVRDLQDRLAALGLSSLGRAEGCVLATVGAVVDILRQLTGREPHTCHPASPTFAHGRALLAEHTAALLGMPPRGRAVRIMVTMPGEAADDYALVRDLLAGGMDCMRVNCAHDGPVAWERMIDHLRRAQQELNKPCRVLMDLLGRSCAPARWRPARRW